MSIWKEGLFRVELFQRGNILRIQTTCGCTLQHVVAPYHMCLHITTCGCPLPYVVIHYHIWLCTLTRVVAHYRMWCCTLPLEVAHYCRWLHISLVCERDSWLLQNVTTGISQCQLIQKHSKCPTVPVTFQFSRILISSPFKFTM